MISSMRFLGAVLSLSVVLGGSAAAGGLPTVALQPMAEGYASVMSLVELPGGGFLLADQIGLLRAVDAKGASVDEPVADLRPRMVEVNKNYDERGLLDVALHPKFAENRKLYVCYNAPLRKSAPADWDDTLTVSEFVLTAGSPLKVDLASERVILQVDKPFGNHNGGRIAFGPDGFLYLGTGDGGNFMDRGKRPPEGNGQHLRTMLGKILRVDVDRGQPYTVPQDNPFADGKVGLPEIYAMGLRNPWGISFDQGGKRELFVADVGQDLFEEINIIVKGGNYGWNRREGFYPFDPDKPKTLQEPAESKGARGEALVDPIIAYPHRVKSADEIQGISVTGGYVYRGSAVPELAGRYVFADWSRNMGVADGRLLVASRPTSGARWELASLPVEGFQDGKLKLFITAFGQDSRGEIYVLTNNRGNPGGTGGKVWKIVPGR
jgi:hypothetical protein